jgi:fructose PTS system EIIBC or EIIC component
VPVGSSGGGRGAEVRRWLMTGVSYMIPFVVAGGILIALSFAIGGAVAVTETDVYERFSIAAMLFKIGGLAFSMLVPILAGFIAYAMADRPGIAPGIVGGLIANEIGGPINKTAYAFAIAGLEGGAFGPMAAVMAAGMTPPLALALASAIRPSLFTPAERRNGQANWVLGASFITEGAIPFAAADPLRVIPACMVGSAITGALSLLFGATLQAPHGGIFVIGLIGNWPMYLVAIAIGTVVSAALVVGIKQFTGGSDAEKAPPVAAQEA